jgi:antitoxin ParD1/3/4
MKQLNVSITPHFAKFIHRKVRSGRYSNASEVVREALRRFEQDEEIRKQDSVTDPEGVEVAIAKAFGSIERGDYTEIVRDAWPEGVFCRHRRARKQAPHHGKTRFQRLGGYRIASDARKDLDGIWDFIAARSSAETATAFICPPGQQSDLLPDETRPKNSHSACAPW